MMNEKKRKEEYGDLYLDGADYKEAIGRLYDIIGVLRKECPWDRVQTHETLRRCLLEEAYEAVDAIDNEDMENLREELGDVLLQVIFHGRLGEENGNFSLTEIVNEECEKMIRRHPHVFLEKNSKKNTKSIDKVLEKWENIKVQERGKTDNTSRLKEVPKALPALTRSYKVQKRASECGFDWADVSDAFHKIKEETDELIQCYEETPEDKRSIEDELGDLIFSCVNAARFLDVDPETSLTHTINKFIRRFAYIEEKALACGKTLESMSLEEMDYLWDQAKALEDSNI